MKPLSFLLFLMISGFVYPMDPGNSGGGKGKKAISDSEAAKKIQRTYRNLLKKRENNSSSNSTPIQSINESKIINLMKELGYTPDEGGVCNGIAYMAIQAFLREDGTKFIKRMERIQSMTSINNKTRNDLDLKGFFDGISMYQGCHGIDEYPYQQNWKREYKFFENPKIKTYKGFILSTLSKSMELIQWALSQEKTVAMSFHREGHVIALVKSKGKSPLYLISHDVVVNLSETLKVSPDTPAKLILAAIDNGIGVFSCEILTKEAIDIESTNTFLIHKKEDFLSRSTLSHSNYVLEDILAEILSSLIRMNEFDLAQFIFANYSPEILKKIVNKKRKIPLLLSTILNKQYKFLNLLLSTPGIDPNIIGLGNKTPLGLSLEMGLTETVKRLLNLPNIDINKTSGGVTALSLAAESGNTEIVELLINNRGTDVNKVGLNGDSALIIALKHNRFNIAKLLLTRLDINVDITTISLALDKGQFEIAKSILSKTIDSDNLGKIFLLLMKAIKTGQTKKAKLILSTNGLDLNQTNEHNTTPLGMAVNLGNLEIVRLLLLKPGIDVNKGTPPLILAILGENQTIFELLLSEPGVNINLPNRNGRTALQLAIMQNSTLFAELLVNAGANFSQEDIEKAKNSKLKSFLENKMKEK